MNYWPGTKIMKTHHNAFNWKGKESQLMQDVEMRNINNSKIHLLGRKTIANLTFVTKIKNYGPKKEGDL